MYIIIIIIIKKGLCEVAIRYFAKWQGCDYYMNALKHDSLDFSHAGLQKVFFFFFFFAFTFLYMWENRVPWWALFHSFEHQIQLLIYLNTGFCCYIHFQIQLLHSFEHWIQLLHSFEQWIQLLHSFEHWIQLLHTAESSVKMNVTAASSVQLDAAVTFILTLDSAVTLIWILDSAVIFIWILYSAVTSIWILDSAIALFWVLDSAVTFTWIVDSDSNCAFHQSTQYQAAARSKACGDITPEATGLRVQHRTLYSGIRAAQLCKMRQRPDAGATEQPLKAQ